MPLTLIYSVSATTLGFGFCLDLFCPRTVSPFIGCETPLRDQYSFDCNFSVLACVLGCTCRDKPSWRGHSCDTGDNQRSSGVVIARSRSFGALDHQRRDLHFNRLYLTSRKIGHNLLSRLCPRSSLVAGLDCFWFSWFQSFCFISAASFFTDPHPNRFPLQIKYATYSEQ